MPVEIIEKSEVCDLDVTPSATLDFYPAYHRFLHVYRDISSEPCQSGTPRLVGVSLGNSIFRFDAPPDAHGEQHTTSPCQTQVAPTLDAGFVAVGGKAGTSSWKEHG